MHYATSRNEPDMRLRPGTWVHLKSGPCKLSREVVIVGFGHNDQGAATILITSDLAEWRKHENLAESCSALMAAEWEMATPWEPDQQKHVLFFDPGRALWEAGDYCQATAKTGGHLSVVPGMAEPDNQHDAA